MTERLNIISQLNMRIKSPVISVKRCLYKTSRFISAFFILSSIVQGTSLESGNSNLSVGVLHQHGNPITNERGSTAPEKKLVTMHHQPDWATELENTVEKAKELDLSRKNLKELPACLKRTEELNISRNRLAAVPLEHLGANKRLKMLEICDYRNVAFLEEGSALENLKCLIANFCNWKVIPASVGQCTQLEELHLAGNLLRSFDPEFFLNLPSLKVLNLSGNVHLTFGSEPWTSLKGLKRLNLREIGFDKIPDNIGALENLFSLDVSYNKIKRLDSEMLSKLSCLEKLDIGHNKDLVIDESTWESLRGLTSLSAKRIGLTEIPTGLKKLIKLKELNMWDNEFFVLNPADFAGFPDLECLEFGHLHAELNRLDVVTTGWGHLKSLKKLFIHGSNLEVLDAWIGGLQSLEDLNLIGNSIHTINDEFFVEVNNLPNFRVLNLAANKIRTLPHSILLLKDKNVKIILEGNDIEVEASETNVGRERLEKEFGEKMVF